MTQGLNVSVISPGNFEHELSVSLIISFHTVKEKVMTRRIEMQEGNRFTGLYERGMGGYYSSLAFR